MSKSESSELGLGKLFLVPTPIGNLGDMTPRAAELLQSVDFVFAEDTRVTGNLLKHLGVQANLRSFHAHNEHKKLNEVIELLKEGKDVALVSDAGTPGISDPGFLLVRAALEAQIDIECLPGASALIPALVVSGFPTDRFVFEGFLPHKKGRKKRLEGLLDESRTIVFYESPYRILKLLEELIENGFENRRICVSRELSKKFEEIKRGTPPELLEHFTEKAPKGEFVVVLEGRP